jgi:hypothetical protein
MRQAILKRVLQGSFANGKDVVLCFDEFLNINGVKVIVKRDIDEGNDSYYVTLYVNHGAQLDFERLNQILDANPSY